MIHFYQFAFLDPSEGGNDDRRSAGDVLGSDLVEKQRDNHPVDKNPIFFLIHSAGLSLVVTQLEFGTWPHTATSTIGVWLGFLWLFLAVRTNHWVRFWEERLAALERIEPLAVALFGGSEFQQVQRGPTVHQSLIALVWTFIAIWIGFVVVSHLRFMGRW